MLERSKTGEIEGVNFGRVGFRHLSGVDRLPCRTLNQFRTSSHVGNTHDESKIPLIKKI